VAWEGLLAHAIADVPQLQREYHGVAVEFLQFEQMLAQRKRDKKINEDQKIPGNLFKKIFKFGPFFEII
jgi:hypothetical protein